MFPAVGWVTASAKAVATAASTAFPPSRSTPAPTSDAIALCDTTMPWRARSAALSAPAKLAVSGRASSSAGRSAAEIRKRSGFQSLRFMRFPRARRTRASEVS